MFYKLFVVIFYDWTGFSIPKRKKEKRNKALLTMISDNVCFGEIFINVQGDEFSFFFWICLSNMSFFFWICPLVYGLFHCWRIGWNLRHVLLYLIIIILLVVIIYLSSHDITDVHFQIFSNKLCLLSLNKQ